MKLHLIVFLLLLSFSHALCAQQVRTQIAAPTQFERILNGSFEVKRQGNEIHFLPRVKGAFRIKYPKVKSLPFENPLILGGENSSIKDRPISISFYSGGFELVPIVLGDQQGYIVRFRVPESLHGPHGPGIDEIAGVVWREETWVEIPIDELQPLFDGATEEERERRRIETEIEESGSTLPPQ